MELPADLQARAEAELNETVDSRTAGLSSLREMLASRTATLHRDDEPYLLMFLRHAKFDVAKAYGRLMATEKWLHDCRAEIGDVSAIHGDDFKEFYNGVGCIRILDNHRRVKEGAVVALLYPQQMAAIPDPTILLKWNVWALERLPADPYLQVCGQVIIENFEGYSTLDLMGFNKIPSAIMRKNFKFQQECLPVRMRGIWIVHPPTFINILFALVRPFLSKKLKERIRIFKSKEELHKQVDPAVLPASLGGSHHDNGLDWFAAELEREAAERKPKEAQEEALAEDSDSSSAAEAAPADEAEDVSVTLLAAAQP